MAYLLFFEIASELTSIIAKAAAAAVVPKNLRREMEEFFIYIYIYI
jgi:hypothetical protein